MPSKHVPQERTYAAGLLASAGLFALLNYFDFHRQIDCADCFFPYGKPFTFFREGGYAGGGGVVWTGLTADVLAVVMVAAVLAYLWKWCSGQLSKP
jgi:hypothetical protein